MAGMHSQVSLPRSNATSCSISKARRIQSISPSSSKRKS